MRLSLYLIAAALAVFTAVTNALAVEYSLYWHLAWFDAFPHFSAGAMLGILLYLMARTFCSPRQAFFVAIGTTFFIGIAWEIFEYLIGATTYTASLFADTVIDTVADMIVDTLGAVVGAYLARKKAE